MMKSNFAYHCDKRNPELSAYLHQHLAEPTFWKSTLSFGKVLYDLNEKAPIPEDILTLLMEQKVKFEAPPPPKMTKEQKEQIIKEEMTRFDDSVIEDIRIPLERDGYKGYIRKIYLSSTRPYTERDVEYYITLDNHEECRTLAGQKSWGAFIYINREGYLSNGTYKSLAGTDYGVQWT